MEQETWKTLMKVLMVLEEERARINAGDCSLCKKPIDLMAFKDERSRKEFAQSGLCHVCQDNFFEGGNL